MSTSGPAIFDDDLACDVRDGYRRLLEDGVSDDEATRQTIDGWTDLASDEEPTLWLALAATQSPLGRLDEHVRLRALAVIDSAHDVARWQELGAGPGAARAAALAALREQLTGPQPKRRPVRRPWRYVTDLEPGTALAWTASTGMVAVLRVVQVQQDLFTGARQPVLERLAWTGDDVPPADVLVQLGAAAADVPRPAGGAGLHTPGVYVPFKLKMRDPDWADLGFTVCGQVPARPGDDGDWSMRAAYLFWNGLPIHLELALVGTPPEQ